MSREETIKIMSVLRGAYPNFYRNVTRQEALDAINLWGDMFAEEPYELVAAAVKILIATDDRGFPPHIGAVKEKIRQFTGPRGGEMTEADAWNLVAAAVRNGIYGAKEEFEKLPPILRRIVGSPATLREWAAMDSETLHSVVSSNFQRSYRYVAAAEKEYQKLPDGLKEMVSCAAKPVEIDTPSADGLPVYESQDDALRRLEASRRTLWEAVGRQEAGKGRAREQVIARLRNEAARDGN